MGPEAIQYLDRMQALSLATVSLQELTITRLIEYRPSPELAAHGFHNFLPENTVYCRHGHNGQVSLLLYHSVMFAATAFIGHRSFVSGWVQNSKGGEEKFFQKEQG